MPLSIAALCTKYHYPEWRYAECRDLLTVMLNVFMLSVAVLNVFMLSDIILSVVMLNVCLLNISALKRIIFVVILCII
jgi:hypothetical protein